MMFPSSPSSPSKLTNWANEPTLEALKNDQMAARNSHMMQVGKIQRWSDLLKVQGKEQPKPVKGRSRVQPKTIRRQAEWRYSALTEPFLGTDKLFQVKPVTWEDADAAKQNEMVLNYQFRTKLNRVKFIDDYVRANVDEGTVIVRVGWVRRTIKVKQQSPVYTHYQITDPNDAQALQQALELEQSDPHGFSEQATPEIAAAVAYYHESGQPSIAKQTGTQTTEVEKVLENRPTVEVMNPTNVVIDPSCNGDIDKAMYAIIASETNKAALLAEGKRYHNLEQIDWQGAAPINEPDYATSTPNDFQMMDKLRKKIVSYEYWGFWDIHNDGVLHPIVVTWIGSTVIRMELNPYPDGKIPIILAPYLPVKRELYGEPDAELIEDNQKIMGALVRGMIDLLGRSANSQQGFAKGMLDPLNRRRYENGQDYEFNPNMPPQQGMMQHTFPELPQSALMMLNLQNQDAEALSGTKSFSGGISGDAYGQVAAGIKGALDAAAKREMAILRRLAMGMTKLGEKIIAMNAVFLSEQEVVRVTNAAYVPPMMTKPGEAPEPDQPIGMGHNGGPNMDDHFVTVNREDLVGNFDLEVDISTAEVDNAQAQDLAFMLQTIGNSMDISITMMILAQICDLKRMPELAHKLRTYQPQPDPIKQQEQQLQLKKLQAEVDEINSRAAKNNADAQLAESNAKKNAIEAQDIESGVAHSRAKDLAEAQAQGNKELAVTKALVTPRKDGERAPNIEAAVGYNNLTTPQPQISHPTLPVSVDNSQQTLDSEPAEQGQPSPFQQNEPAPAA